MQTLTNQFETLTREQILAIRAGAHGNYELLDVMRYFEQEKTTPEHGFGEHDRVLALYDPVVKLELSFLIAQGVIALRQRLANHTA